MTGKSRGMMDLPKSVCLSLALMCIPLPSYLVTVLLNNFRFLSQKKEKFRTLVS